MDYSELIKGRRKIMKYSQQRLAELVGVSRSSVRLWETGETQPTSCSTIAKLEVALGFSEGEFYSLLTHKIHKAGLLSLMCSNTKLPTQKKGA